MKNNDRHTKIHLETISDVSIHMISDHYNQYRLFVVVSIIIDKKKRGDYREEVIFYGETRVLEKNDLLVSHSSLNLNSEFSQNSDGVIRRLFNLRLTILTPKVLRWIFFGQSWSTSYSGRGWVEAGPKFGHLGPKC